MLDLIVDPYQPRVFLSLLGIPACDMPRAYRWSSHVNITDIRTDKDVAVYRPHAAKFKTTTFSLRFSEGGEVWLERECAQLAHFSNQGVIPEGFTYSCDLPVDSMQRVRASNVHLYLTTIETGQRGENLHERGMTFDGPNRNSAGLFRSAKRPNPHDLPVPVTVEGWHQLDKESREQPEEKATMSLCLIGVDYWSIQAREVIQYYVSVGYDHICIGVPMWPKSDKFQQLFAKLRDFIEEGYLSLVISYYTEKPINPTFFGRNFTYAPQGHKGSFINTCIIAARAFGDSVVHVADMDEMVVHSYGNKTSIKEVVSLVAKEENTTINEFCAINMASYRLVYYNTTSGPNHPGLIVDKMEAIYYDKTDSVTVYGKTLHNAKRIMRTGLHGPANCEQLYEPGMPVNVTRPNILDKVGSGMLESRTRDGGPWPRPYNRSVYPYFRPYVPHLATLHLGDSFRKRSGDLDLRKRCGGTICATPELQDERNHYLLDWAEIVQRELIKRHEVDNSFPITG